MTRPISEARRHLAMAREALEAALEPNISTRYRITCINEASTQVDLADQELEDVSLGVIETAKEAM